MSDFLNVQALKDVLHVLAQTAGRSNLHEVIEELDADPNAPKAVAPETPEEELARLRARNAQLEAAAAANGGA